MTISTRVKAARKGAGRRLDWRNLDEREGGSIIVSISRTHADCYGWPSAQGRARVASSPVSVLLRFGVMIQMHSRPKEQREAVRNLVHLVLIRDMGTFNPERFKDWIKDIDARFRKVGLTLSFEIRSRTVHFTIKEIRSGRTAFNFSASTRVQFDDRDVVMSVEDFAKPMR